MKFSKVCEALNGEPFCACEQFGLVEEGCTKSLIISVGDSSIFWHVSVVSVKSGRADLVLNCAEECHTKSVSETRMKDEAFLSELRLRLSSL